MLKALFFSFYLVWKDSAIVDHLQCVCSKSIVKDLFYPSHPPSVAIGFLCCAVVDFNLITFQIMFLLLLFTENNKVNYY